MKRDNILRLRRRLGAAGRVAAIVMVGAWFGQALAQTSNALADAPLFTASTNPIPPNLMFILDDSGSMQWDFMPDDADILNRNMYGRSSSQCNGLAYDPKQSYTPPYDVDSSDLTKMVQDAAADITAWTKPDPTTQTADQVSVKSISAVPTKGNSVTVVLTGGMMLFDKRNAQTEDTVTVFKDASNYFIAQVAVSDYNNPLTVTLSVVSVTGTIGSGTVTGYKIGKGEPVNSDYYVYKGSQTRLAWDKADGSLDTTSTFYKECTAAVTTTSAVFTKVTVASSTAADQQNYANWAKFYRSRIMMMKSASRVAFKDVGNGYRVGYSAISQPSAKTGAANFLHVDKFEKAQKQAFYNQLKNAVPGTSGTPLRGALAKAGQYFANKALNQDKDPMQYSCQRNFAMMSTDGYWNEGASTGAESQLSCSTSASGTTSCSVRGTGTGYGPFKFDRTSPVMNVDSALPRPMADGDTLKSTTTETWSTVNTGQYKFVTGSDLVHSTQAYKDATGTAAQDTRNDLSIGAGCGGGKKWQVSTPNTRNVPGTRELATITENRDRTLRTVVVQRTQQTDYVRTVVVNNGATISDSTKSTPVTPTDTPVSDTSATSKVGPTTLPQTDTLTLGTPGAWTKGTPVNTACVNSPVTQTGTVNETLLAPLTNFGSQQSRTLADRTAPVTPTEGWVATPSTADTDHLSDTTFQSSNGSNNTLADVAAFYYENDLRNTTLNNCTGALNTDVCTDNVPGTPLTDPYKSFGDSAHTQHMTTFTLGLGVSGSLKYDPNYITMRSGDFHDIVNMAKNWPNTTAGANTTVDDLWHAAVNGRGQYFSAGSPGALSAGLQAALASIQTVIGSASAASTSSLQPVAGDNDIFVAQFTTKEWTGDVLAYTIDPNTGTIPTTITWSAQAQLDAADATKRTIYYNSAGKGLVDFSYTNLTADGLNKYFDSFCTLSGAGSTSSSLTVPTQCATLLPSDATLANTGSNLVTYLRGDQTMTYYRTRTKRLGDIINASPLFVGKPAFKYPNTEHNYADFAAAKATRKAVVLAAANDGMLHAFDRTTGNELWAFIPTAVIPELHKLADTNFQNAHQYYVDGSPQMGDVWDSNLNSWRTIVVGGLNKGGRSYYALDVTDPSKPTVMWEYSANNLGYTFGNPIITKRKDGTWVVVFASGYENVSSGTYVGDGNGHLFVVDAITGTDVISGGIPTLDAKNSAAVGSTSAPSGLAHINSWVDTDTDNTSLRFYGGDELGNLWRFDLDGNVAPKNAALQLGYFQVKDASGTLQPQPITTKPAVALISYNGTNYPVVYVGTGSYQRVNDSKNSLVQSIYALADPLTATSYGDVRGHTDIQVQTITAGVDSKKVPTRASTTKTVDWSKQIGWMADFPVGGERVSVAPQLALDTLYLSTNLPKDEDCSVGGNSFLYQFSIQNGDSDAVFIGNVLVQGLTLVQLVTGSNAGSIVSIITRSDGTLQTEVGAPPAVTGVLRRTSWRELVD